MEMKIAAALSKDERMMEIVQDPDQDIHKVTASVAYGIPVGDVTKPQRTNAKTVGFGIMYGRGTEALANALGITLEEAGRLIRSFFEAYPGIRRMFNRNENFMLKHGYVYTWYGRRRRFWEGPVPPVHELAIAMEESVGKARSIVGSWKRQGNNMIIQGTGADVVKMAMLRVNNAIEENDWGDTELVGQVHDELIALTPEEHAKDVLDMMCTLMPVEINGIKLGVEGVIKPTLSKAA